mmetsp:Transcript_2416/g.5396  ORF Transcript_2416/g.5396 Transcript_2416/m.5396 type:complete len:248 (+) Transcript_2416:293-1036(+)
MGLCCCLRGNTSSFGGLAPRNRCSELIQYSVRSGFNHAQVLHEIGLSASFAIRISELSASQHLKDGSHPGANRHHHLIRLPLQIFVMLTLLCQLLEVVVQLLVNLGGMVLLGQGLSVTATDSSKVLAQLRNLPLVVLGLANELLRAFLHVRLLLVGLNKSSHELVHVRLAVPRRLSDTRKSLFQRRDLLCGYVDCCFFTHDSPRIVDDRALAFILQRLGVVALVVSLSPSLLCEQILLLPTSMHLCG